MSRRQAGSDVYHAIADPHRRMLLELLSRGERSVTQLARSFRLSQPGLSQHLRVLRSAGLVRARARGREKLYSLRAPRLKKVADWIGQYERFWRGRLDALGRHLEETP